MNAFVIASTGVVLPWRPGKESGKPWRTKDTELLRGLMNEVSDNNPEVLFGKGGILVVDFDPENLVGFANMVDLHIELGLASKGRWSVIRSRNDGVKVLILTPYGDLSKFKRHDLYRLIRSYLPERFHACIDPTADPRRSYVTDKMLPLVTEALGELVPQEVVVENKDFRLWAPGLMGRLAPSSRKGNWDRFLQVLEAFRVMANSLGEVNLSCRVVGSALQVHHTVAARYLKKARKLGLLGLVNQSVIPGIKGYTYQLRRLEGEESHPLPSLPQEATAETPQLTLDPVTICSFSTQTEQYNALPATIEDGSWNQTMLKASQKRVSNEQLTSWFRSLPGHNHKDREDQFKRILATRRSNATRTKQEPIPGAINPPQEPRHLTASERKREATSLVYASAGYLEKELKRTGGDAATIDRFHKMTGQFEWVKVRAEDLGLKDFKPRIPIKKRKHPTLVVI